MINLALIGVGSWGRNYIKTIGKIKDLNLKYICASTSKSLEKFPDNYIKLTDYKKLVNCKDINGIIIATPATSHYEISRYFLSKGFNLLIEKPLATNYSQAEKLMKVCKGSKSIAMVGHIFLYNKAYLKFKDLASRIEGIKYLDFEGCDYGPFPKDSPVLWEWAPHDVSMCLDLLSEMPIGVSASSVANGMVFARLKFKNVQAFMKFGWLSLEKKRKITVVGEKSSVIFDDTKEKKVIFYNNKKVDEPEYLTYSLEQPLMSEIKEFINCLRNKKNPKTNINNSASVIKVIEAMQRSINSDGKLILL